MIIGKTPFTQWEADVVVYQSDMFGNVAGNDAVWLGGTVNKSNFQDGYKTEEANQSGVPVPNMRQLEEQHVIELENVWMVQVAAGPAFAAPTIPRDQFYAVVIIWTDEETGVWVKRVYAGVELRELSMGSDSEVFVQKLRIEGGVMQQTCGILAESVPSEDATILGMVRYVSPREQVDLYTFDFTNPQEGFQVINPAALAGRGSIGPGTSSGYQISVAGAVALEIYAGGHVSVNQVVGIGGSYVYNNAIPRMEFYAGSSRIASLSAAGELGIPAFIEADADPGISGAFWLGDGETWLASLAPRGLFAAGIADDLS
jgi:hypothetical protein